MSSSRSIALALICAACGSPRTEPPLDGGGGSDSGFDPVFDGGPPGDAGVLDRDGAVRPVETCGSGELSVGHALAGFGELFIGRATHAAVQQSTGRIVALPANVSPALSRLTYVELEPEDSMEEHDATVHTAIVAGEAPAGEIYYTVYLASLDRFVLLTLEREPFRYALYALDLHETRADFTKLEEVGTPGGEGPIFTGMYAAGGARLAVVRAATELYYVDLAGDRATWSGPMTPFGDPSISVTTQVAVDGRLLGWGRRTFDPVTHAEGFEPRLYEIALAPGGAIELPLGPGGPMPTMGPGAFLPFIAYDDVLRRVLVTSELVEMHPIFGMLRRPILYAYDRDLSRWTMLADNFYAQSFGYGTPYAMHSASHRAFGRAGEGLTALDTETGELADLVFDGHPGPSESVTATALDDGRIAAITRGGSIVAIDPSRADARWEILGETKIPDAIRSEPSVAYDATTSSLLVFGGTASFPGMPSAALHRVALDGTSIAEEPIAGGPPARFGHGAIVHEGSMYIVGGGHGVDGTIEQHGDVWALDLGARTWRRVTGVRPRSRMALGVIDGELWIVGGLRYGDAFDVEFVDEVEAIDLATGAVRTVATSGEPPTHFASTVRLGNGFASFDLGDDTLDGTGARLRYLDAAAGTWRDLGACFVDRVVYGLTGVELGTTSYLVGPHVIELRAAE
jgi:hypothetical protein